MRQVSAFSGWLLCALCLAAGGFLSSPALARSQPDPQNQDTERKISNPELFAKSLEAAGQAADYYGLIDDPDQVRRIAEIGYRIGQETNFDKFPFSFFLLDIPVPNAFALPGGHIFLTRGMLELQPTDDMLAGLLGHEVGHVVLDHGMRMQRRATLLNVLGQALLAGVMISASDSNEQTPIGYDPFGRGRPAGGRVMGAAAAGMVVSELLLRSYNREFEDEADDEGQRWAAAAGYDPDGYRQLMELMRERLPESKEYGYWRTHPFFDSRVRAAQVRQELLKIQEPSPADDFRRETQATLLSYSPNGRAKERNGKNGKNGDKDSEESKESARGDRNGTRTDNGRPDRTDLLETAALTAWPAGDEAARIRRKRLQAARDAELEKSDLERDYGRLIGLYDKTIEALAIDDPEHSLTSELKGTTAELRAERDAIYPRATEVFTSGVFQTEFLETFRSNFPEAPEGAKVALALGDAYSRLRRPEEAVGMYLEAHREAEAESEERRRAELGLRNLAPLLEDLGALQRLAAESTNEEVRALAAKRLDESAAAYSELSNGAKYLKRYPESDLADTVNDRLNDLADDLYGEAILYQRVGDNAKALERIYAILTEAPFSPAADKLRQGADFET